jgi:hypothetical protein
MKCIPYLQRKMFLEEFSPEMLLQMENRFAHAVNIMKQAIQKTKLEKNLVDEAATTFNEIFKYLKETLIQIDQVAKSAQQMAKSNEVAITAVNKIAAISEDFLVEHRMTNRGNWPINFALWPISMMNIGGMGIIPQYRIPDQEGLLPNRFMALWPYSDMNDSRVYWGSKYVMIKQDSRKVDLFKVGLSVPQGWVAYTHTGYLFIKQFKYDPKCSYPDGGVNVEVYIDKSCLEVESLGPLQMVTPGNTATHIEIWKLYKNVGSIKTEDDIDREIVPLIQ